VRVNVADLLDDREATRDLTFSERFEPPTDDVTLPEPVEGTFVLSATGGTVRLAGRARTVAAVVCGACLTRYAQPLEIAVDEEFYRAAPHAEAGREELHPADFLTPLDPGDVLDVTEVVRQHLVLALPIAPRCREDCRGLCPRCGADRNTGACHCDEHAVDPRLEPLRQWSARPGGKTRRAPAPPGARRRKRASGE
jgi:DUF177 domain-containing protein